MAGMVQGAQFQNANFPNIHTELDINFAQRDRENDAPITYFKAHTYLQVMPEVGIEPTTHAPQLHASTTELLRHTLNKTGSAKSDHPKSMAVTRSAEGMFSRPSGSDYSQTRRPYEFLIAQLP